MKSMPPSKPFPEVTLLPVVREFIVKRPCIISINGVYYPALSAQLKDKTLSCVVQKDERDLEGEPHEFEFDEFIECKLEKNIPVLGVKIKSRKAERAAIIPFVVIFFGVEASPFKTIPAS